MNSNTASKSSMLRCERTWLVGSPLAFVEQEVEVVLRIVTTREDALACLARSGIREGELVGEAMVMSVVVYAPEEEEEGNG